MEHCRSSPSTFPCPPTCSMGVKRTLLGGYPTQASQQPEPLVICSLQPSPTGLERSHRRCESGRAPAAASASVPNRSPERCELQSVSFLVPEQSSRSRVVHHQRSAPPIDISRRKDAATRCSCKVRVFGECADPSRLCPSQARRGCGRGGQNGNGVAQQYFGRNAVPARGIDVLVRG